MERLKKVKMYGYLVGNLKEEAQDYYLQDFVSPQTMEQALKEANGEDILIQVNSGGGDVFCGITISNQLREYKGKVTAVVHGLCGSAATIALTGADEVYAYDNAMYMIHYASMFVFGYYNANEFIDLAVQLEAFDRSTRASYEKKFKGTTEELDELLSKDTFMTAQDAVDYGFITGIVTDEMVERWKDEREDNAGETITASQIARGVMQDFEKGGIKATDIKTEQRTEAEETEQKKQGIPFFKKKEQKTQQNLLQKFKGETKNE